jgi:4-amino-4-deoxy-L-arabinose transferase-like glycosyltransferase
LRLYVGWFIVLSVGVLLFLLFMSKELDAITDIDALDYAQLARNMAQGNGYVTQFVRPLSLAKVPVLDHHPEMTFMPLHPLVMAGFMRIVGANKSAADLKVAVGLSSAIPFLLTLILIYLLGLRLFDRRVAVIGTLFMAVSLWVLRCSISGLEAPLLGLLFTALIWVLYLGIDSKRRTWWMLLGGGLVGLLALTKEVWGLALLPVLWYVSFGIPRLERRARWVALVAVFGGFVVAILPWCIRQGLVTGNPFFTWRWYEMVMETQTNPANTLYRSYRAGLQSPLQLAVLHPKELYQKVLAGIATLYNGLPTAIGPYVAAFFFVAILFPMGDRRFERLRYLLYSSYLLVFVALVLILPSPRLLYPVVPLASLIAAACFMRVLTPAVKRVNPRLERRATLGAITALVLIQATPLLTELLHPMPPDELQILRQQQDLAKAVAEDTTGPLVADQPWLMAWYGERTAIWLPRSWDDLDRLEQDIGQVRFLLLTPWIAQYTSSEHAGEWMQMWQQAQGPNPQPQHGFAVYRIYPGNWVLFVRVPRLPANAPAPPANAAPASVARGGAPRGRGANTVGAR